MKMLKFVVFALVALFLVAVKTTPLQPSTGYTENLLLEEPCVRQGGLCLSLEDCDPENLVNIAVELCPKQKHLGVKCCYI